MNEQANHTAKNVYNNSSLNFWFILSPSKRMGMMSRNKKATGKNAEKNVNPTHATA